MRLKDDVTEPVKLKVVWKDSKGKIAPVQGATSIVSDNEDAVTIVDVDGVPAMVPGPMANVGEADEDGLLARVGLRATADADLGEGVQEVAAIGTVELMVGTATTGEIALA